MIQLLASICLWVEIYKLVTLDRWFRTYHFMVANKAPLSAVPDDDVYIRPWERGVMYLGIVANIAFVVFLLASQYLYLGVISLALVIAGAFLRYRFNDRYVRVHFALDSCLSSALCIYVIALELASAKG